MPQSMQRAPCLTRSSCTIGSSNSRQSRTRSAVGRLDGSCRSNSMNPVILPTLLPQQSKISAALAASTTGDDARLRLGLHGRQHRGSLGPPVLQLLLLFERAPVLDREDL